MATCRLSPVPRAPSPQASIPHAPIPHAQRPPAQPLQVHPAGLAGSSDTGRHTEGGGCRPAPQPHPSGHPWLPATSLSLLLETVGSMEPPRPHRALPRAEEVEGGLLTGGRRIEGGPRARQRQRSRAGAVGRRRWAWGPHDPASWPWGGPHGPPQFVELQTQARTRGVAGPACVPVGVSADVPGATGHRAPCPSRHCSYECHEPTATAVSLHEGAPPWKNTHSLSRPSAQ